MTTTTTIQRPQQPTINQQEHDSCTHDSLQLTAIPSAFPSAVMMLPSHYLTDATINCHLPCCLALATGILLPSLSLSFTLLTAHSEHSSSKQFVGGGRN